MRPVAVLGGTGLIGRHVIEALAHAGYPIIATANRRSPFEKAGVEWRRADLTCPKAARDAVRAVHDLVICAGRLSTAAELKRDPIGSVTTTLRIGVNALEAAAAEGIERIVLVSSTTGYPPGEEVKVEDAMYAGDPPSDWFGVGWVHRFLEKQLNWYCRLGRIKGGVAVRPTLVYGPYDDFDLASAHFVPSFVRRVVERERPIEIWGDGNQRRNLVHASDVAAAIVTALQGEPGFGAYNVAAPQSCSVREVVTTLVKLDRFDDAEILYKPERVTGAPSLDVSAEAFCTRYGWKASVSLRDGLSSTLEWYRNSYERRSPDQGALHRLGRL
ncbi:MAG: NAD(P)-dependent oxidoreductase [Enhydrobacter sp.]|nr:NAD(P)-dependent oxidoreductase [Enhydrobacter sp.]